MNLTDVIDLYVLLDSLGIEIRLDGGWGVDALLGEQTRPHDDLDIVVQQKDVPALRDALQRRGYKDVPRGDTHAWNFVLGDDEGRQIDVHVIVLDGEGNGIYGPVENGLLYPAGSLTGTGLLAGQVCRCISPEYMVKFHSGYKLRDKDVQDVSALCARFGIPLPEEYGSLRRAPSQQQ